MGAQPTKGPIGDWYEANPLRAWRRNHERTLRSIADQLGVNISMINKWEIGVCSPRMGTLWDIALMMDKPCSALFDDWAAWQQQRPRASA